MTDVFVAVGALLLFGAIVNSCVRFSHAAITQKEGAEHRVLGAFSSFVSLLVLCLIYSGQFRWSGVNAFWRLSADRGDTESVREILTRWDTFFTHVANLLSPGADVGYRPHPTIWPALLLATLYILRALIYFSVTRLNLKSAALTGPVYWSHLSGYAMLVSFFVVIVQWNAVAVVALSAAGIGVALVGLVVFEDLAFLVREYAGSIAHLVRGLVGRVAQNAVAFARAVRGVVQDAHHVYVAHVRTPLRRSARRAAEASKNFEDRATMGLREEDALNARLFGGGRDATQTSETPEAPASPNTA